MKREEFIAKLPFLLFPLMSTIWNDLTLEDLERMHKAENEPHREASEDRFLEGIFDALKNIAVTGFNDGAILQITTHERVETNKDKVLEQFEEKIPDDMKDKLAAAVSGGFAGEICYFHHPDNLSSRQNLVVELHELLQDKKGLMSMPSPFGQEALIATAGEAIRRASAMEASLNVLWPQINEGLRKMSKEEVTPPVEVDHEVTDTRQETSETTEELHSEADPKDPHKEAKSIVETEEPPIDLSSTGGDPAERTE